MVEEHIHVSHGVTKLGTDIPSISLPAGVTCNPDAPCFRKCYARRGRFCFSHNRELLERNLRIWKERPDVFEAEASASAIFHRYFRWFSSGDMPDENFFRMMVRIAEKLPGTQFLAFTKKFAIVNDYLSGGGVLPGNLHMVLSAWGDWLPENPHNLPVAYIRFKTGDNSHIPPDAFQCPKYCGECVSSGNSCWDLQKGESVCFREH